jgi:hypothetical protein
MVEFRAQSGENPVFSEEVTMQMVAESIPGIVTSRCGYVQPS